LQARDFGTPAYYDIWFERENGRLFAIALGIALGPAATPPASRSLNTV
jgi:hypothetical protein